MAEPHMHEDDESIKLPEQKNSAKMQAFINANPNYLARALVNKLLDSNVFEDIEPGPHLQDRLQQAMVKFIQDNTGASEMVANEYIQSEAFSKAYVAYAENHSIEKLINFLSDCITEIRKSVTLDKVTSNLKGASLPGTLVNEPGFNYGGKGNGLGVF